MNLPEVMKNRLKSMTSNDVLNTMIKIGELSAKIANTNNQAIKFADGEMSAEEFAPIKEQRKAWRAEINRLKEEMKNLSQN